MKYVEVTTFQRCDFQNSPKTLKPYFHRYNCTCMVQSKSCTQSYTVLCRKHTKYTKAQK